jgi:hypothetical protein
MTSEKCQCSSKCDRPIVSGTPFCHKHLLKGCGRQSPMSGSEPVYDPDKYNKDTSIRHSHNCFAYAFGVIDENQKANCQNTSNCNVPFHGPGIKSGFRRLSGKDGKTCADTMARTLADSDGGYPIGFTGRCKRGFSKIATVVDPSADFHYYRQDTNGLWSHKPGAMPVTNKDSLGDPIYDPALAGRYYPSEREGDHELDYNSFCGYYCIPRDKTLKIASGGYSGSGSHRSRAKRAAVASASTTRRRDRSKRKTRRQRQPSKH